MYFTELAMFLSTCYIATGFSLFGHGNGLKFRFKEINDSLASSRVQTRWMRQPLDHFDESENRTWKMRYFRRLDLWKPRGPIYLFISGEERAYKGFLQSGLIYELAKETNGAMFQSEHRYYGDSKPFENYTTENLKYLSSRQALADNARLLKRIKSSPWLHSSKVVVVGGSYAGNLAAWMKLLYPDLVDVAIASSAPVLAKVDFYEYLETVSDDFEQYGTPGCLNIIEKIFKRYDKMLRTADGIKALKVEEQICYDTDMSKLENRQLFFLTKVSVLSDVAQYKDLVTIKSYCEEIKSNPKIFSTLLDGTLWNETRQCFDYEFDYMVEISKKLDSVLPWNYQTCTEFGYYQTTNSKKHPFTDNIPLEFFHKTCTATFGPDFDEKRVNEGVHKTNKLYGGLKPNVTKVIFVNGDLDPWHRLSVLENIAYEAPAKVIPYSSHCRDLFPQCSNDPAVFIEARTYVKSLVKKWIGVEKYVN